MFFPGEAARRGGLGRLLQVGRLQKTGALLAVLAACQVTPFSFEVHHAVQVLLMSSPAFATDEATWARSCALEQTSKTNK